jgi:curved DNA-binding protein CbpA
LNIFRCYEILGLEPGASIEEVKIAYRDLVKVWHPDRFINDPRLQLKSNEKIKEINEAYNELLFFLRYSEKHNQYQEVRQNYNETKNNSVNNNKNEAAFRPIKFSLGNLCLLFLVVIIIMTVGSLYHSKNDSILTKQENNQLSNESENKKNNDKYSKQNKNHFEQYLSKFAPPKTSYLPKLSDPMRDPFGDIGRDIAPKTSYLPKQPDKGPVQNDGDSISGYSKLKVPNSLILGSSPFGSGILNGNSNLKVENGTNEDTLVKLTQIHNKDQLIRNFYIPSKLSYTANKILTGKI